METTRKARGFLSDKCLDFTTEMDQLYEHISSHKAIKRDPHKYRKPKEQSNKETESYLSYIR